MRALTRSRLARLRPARRASDATLRRYTVVPSRAVRGYRSAVVDSATFQNGTLFPFLARVAEPAGSRMRLWLHADDEQAVAPDDLGLRIPAPIRGALNIPPNTIIELRRKLRPALQGQLNQLTVPVAGLVAAAAALPEVRGWPLVIGGLLAVGFGLAPLRMPRPPRGPWP